MSPCSDLKLAPTLAGLPRPRGEGMTKHESDIYARGPGGPASTGFLPSFSNSRLILHLFCTTYLFFPLLLFSLSQKYQQRLCVYPERVNHDRMVPHRSLLVSRPRFLLTSSEQSTNCRRRLIRDFKRLSSDPPGGISGSPCPDNIMLWNAVIFGPGEYARPLFCQPLTILSPSRHAL